MAVQSLKPYSGRLRSRLANRRSHPPSVCVELSLAILPIKEKIGRMGWNPAI